MSGILCLKWNNHTSTFIKALDVLRSKELYCDATIACHGKYYPVHRFVLTTCSEYFEEIFERTQCKHPFIIVKDVEELQLEALLNYMYKGEVNVLQDRLPGLIRAAEALKIKGLAVSEDNSEEKKPIKEKEKRKSNSSSPLQPKSKKKADRNSNQIKSHSDSDDDIKEIENQSSHSSKKCDENNTASTTENALREVVKDAKFQNNVEDAEDNIDENEVEDIKIEPTEIYENTEEDFVSNSVETQSQTSGKEDSLFVSLLSPNNTHSISQDFMAVNDGEDEAMPQCSSWNDDVSNNSDKTHDEIAGKSQWLESESFDHLAVGSGSYIPTNEERTNKFCIDTTQESLDIVHEQIPISESNGSCINTIKSSLVKFHLSELECSKYLSDITDNSVDITSTIKEEFSATEPEPLSDIDSSSFTALSRFQLPKCSSNYSSLLLDESSNFGNSYKELEPAPDLFSQAKDLGELGKLQCVSCTFRCKDKAALKLHIMRKHTGEKPYSCAICSYRCTTKDMLKIHTRKHTGERPFSCPYCTVRMSVKSSLKRHILLKHIHGKKEQPHQVTQCNPKEPFTFTNKASASSVNIKCYKCKHCSYETQLKSNLNLHNMRIHTGEKPVACIVCPYRTTTKSQLQKHMRRHTGEKPFACTFCSYRAAQKHCLLRHMYIHTR